MLSRVVFYDLPSLQGTSFSVNPLKTRMVLNYKSVDYRTQWVEYPDLAPTLKSFGLPANDKNAPGFSADYSSPAIKFEDGTYGMDSWVIAQELERRYPTPSLHLDNPVVVQVRDLIPQLLLPIAPFLVFKVALLLPKASADYYYKTREERFGAPLPDIEKRASDENWAKVKAPAREVGDLLRKNEGPFFLGETVSYADFLLVSVLHFIKRIDTGGTVFQKFLGLDSTFSDVYSASGEWLEKQD